MKPSKRAAKRRPLDTLELRPERLDGGDVTVRIFVGGKDLLDRVRAIELPLLGAHGKAHIAGTYRGLSPAEWANLSDRDEEGRVTILDCDCGVTGCWPLKVRVTVRATTVTWSDFLSPAVGLLDDALGTFTFARDRYEAEIARIAGAPAT